MLLRLKASEFMEMIQDIGISAWGHRHKIRKAVEEINKTLEDPVNSLNDRKTLDEMLLEEDVLDDNYEDDIVLEENDEKILEKDEERAADIESEFVPETMEFDVNCELCRNSTQHNCTSCGKKICVIRCSETDSDGTNEMRMRHKSGDPRCFTGSFECPACEEVFNIEDDLQKHIRTTHNNLSMSMPSLLSQADDSSWMYMTCNLCNGRFQNEKDLSFHMERVHEYGESCQMYPCDSCEFRTGD